MTENVQAKVQWKEVWWWLGRGEKSSRSMIAQIAGRHVGLLLLLPRRVLLD